MLSEWSRKFWLFLLGWLAGSLALFFSVAVFSPLLYLSSSYAGLLLAIEYSAPEDGRPQGHRRLRWLSLGGFVVFLYVVVDWVLRVALGGASP